MRPQRSFSNLQTDLEPGDHCWKCCKKLCKKTGIFPLKVNTIPTHRFIGDVHCGFPSEIHEYTTVTIKKPEKYKDAAYQRNSSLQETTN